MSDRLEWFPFYTRDWRQSRGVRLLRREARSMYLDVLCEIWEKGPIPDDADAVAMLIGENPDYFRPFWAGIRNLLVESTGGGLTQERIAAEHVKAVAIVESSVARARKGGAARHASSSSASSSASSKLEASSELSPKLATKQAPLTSYLDLSLTRARPIDQQWIDVVGLQPGSGLMDAWRLCEQAAPANGLTPEEYFSKALGAFVQWVDGIRDGVRKPQKSPIKFVQHFARIQEIVNGKREAVPAETPGTSRVEPAQRSYEDLGEKTRRLRG